MNLFFDEDSQRLIINAKKEMYELKHPYVGSEHLLLAILKDDNIKVTKILDSFGINYETFKHELIKVVGFGSKNNDWFLFTPLLKRIINNATYYSKDNNSNVTPYNLLISILQEGDGVANRILLGMNIDLDALYNKFLDFYDNHNSKNKLLEEVAVNMNKQFKSNKFDPVVGRELQVNNIIQILLRKNKNNPLLIGKAGVGKTALIEELVRKICLGEVPAKLREAIVYNLSISSLVSGTKYRGEFEEKLHKIIKEVLNNSNIILFIDEFHTILGAGGAEGAIDAGNILKPYLARGELKVIGATTLDEYDKYLSKDKAFDRRFQKIVIEEPSDLEVKNILLNIKSLYEDFHQVIIENKLIDYFVKLSNECIVRGNQPDKAIDLLDEVCSYCSFKVNNDDVLASSYLNKISKFENDKNLAIVNHDFKNALEYRNKEFDLRSDYNNYIIDKTRKKINIELNDIYMVIHNKTNIPLVNVLNDNRNLFERKLKNAILGQNNVIKDCVSCILNYNFFEKNKPLSMLFVGKSGVGKTFLAEKIAKVFLNMDLITLDFSNNDNNKYLNKILLNSYNYNLDCSDGFLNELYNNRFKVLLIENINYCNDRYLNNILELIRCGKVKMSKYNNINISNSLIILTMTTSGSLGFNRSNNEFINNKIIDNVDKVMYFNDINKKDIEKYLNKQLESSIDKEIAIKKILDESDFINNGFSKINDLLNKYSKYNRVKS